MESKSRQTDWTPDADCESDAGFEDGDRQCQGWRLCRYQRESVSNDVLRLRDHRTPDAGSLKTCRLQAVARAGEGIAIVPRGEAAICDSLGVWARVRVCPDDTSLSIRWPASGGPL